MPPHPYISTPHVRRMAELTRAIEATREAVRAAARLARSVAGLIIGFALIAGATTGLAIAARGDTGLKLSGSIGGLALELTRPASSAPRPPPASPTRPADGRTPRP